MPDTPTSTALDVRRESASLGVPLPPMDDHELSALWRTSKALAESGLFKDALQAGQAFAKVLAGRDLGLTPFESMGSLHVIEGKVEASSDLHATRVRQREGYDFRVAWLKIAEPLATVDLSQPQPFAPGDVSAVWADEEDLADIRDVVGCAIVFTIDGDQRGVSRFLITDAIKAGLIKDRSGWARFPRNMLYARAMTNGVAWFVPEVMGGVRVYGFGEIDRPAGEDLTAGDPRGPIGSDVSDSLPTEVEAVIARARELGHAGLANREAAAMAIGGQPPAYVATWVRNATGELNRLAAGRPEPEPVDAEVVEPQEGDVTAGEGEATQPPPEPVDAPQEPQGAPEAPESTDPPEGDGEAWPLADRIQSCRDDIERANADGDRETFLSLAAELEGLLAEQAARENPDQSTLGL